MILDSNLIIYAARPEYPGLRRFIAAHSLAVSAVSVVEVLGYHKLSAADRAHFEAFFAAAEVLSLSDSVVPRAVAIRQTRKMSLGDALVAATALVFGRELLTHNIKDFAAVPGLVVSDPLANGDPE
ncbi:PIN domain-containing protein [Paludisphaera rhizosphaerae]|uniref:PIN domain-containing protein n=1 Tax=Paludisphaera rhizosphaerae TaxID=2711216 RepID=UPI0013EE0A8D|nr:PIN domain-containing protein [Paludisphaera rhizosphaerae]